MDSVLKDSKDLQSTDTSAGAAAGVTQRRFHGPWEDFGGEWLRRDDDNQNLIHN